LGIEYLIDGYNLLLRWHRGRLRAGPGNLERARDALVAWIGRHLPPDDSATIVFDTPRSAPTRNDTAVAGRVRIVFAVGYDSADEWIIEKCADSPAAIIISSDWQIQAAARRSNVGVLSSDEFLALLSEGTAKKQGVERTTNERKPSSESESEKPAVPLTPEELEELRAFMALPEKEPAAPPPAPPSGIVPPRRRPNAEDDLEDFYRKMREAEQQEDV
jgi:predicted RNA-binding protein with PIN domain